MIFSPGIQGASSGGFRCRRRRGALRWLTPPSRSAAPSGPRCFSTLASSATVDYLRHHGAAAARQATLDGYLTVFGWAALVFGVGALLSATLLRSGPMVSSGDGAPVMAH